MANFQSGLLITAIGMGLVFMVIIALWGLMALLVKITTKKDQVGEQVALQDDNTQPVDFESNTKTKLHPKIAAIAVAAAINLTNATSSKMASSHPAEISLWQNVNRMQQLQNKPGIRKHQ